MSQPPPIQNFQSRRPRDKSLLVAGAVTGALATVAILGLAVAGLVSNGGGVVPTVLSGEKKIIKNKLKEEYGSNPLKIKEWIPGKSYIVEMNIFGKPRRYRQSEADPKRYDSVLQKGNHWTVHFETYHPVAGWVQEQRTFYFEGGKLVQVDHIPLH